MEDLKSIGAKQEYLNNDKFVIRYLFLFLSVAITMVIIYTVAQYFIPNILLKINFGLSDVVMMVYPIVLIAFVPLILHKTGYRKKYLPCPYCDSSVKMHEQWVCNYCKHQQAKPRHLTKFCEECERENKSFFCEHCHEEFIL